MILENSGNLILSNFKVYLPFSVRIYVVLMHFLLRIIEFFYRLHTRFKNRKAGQCFKCFPVTKFLQRL